MIADLLFRPFMRAATVQQLGHPAAGVVGWLGGSQVTGGVAVDQDTALTYSAVWAATSLLSSTAACLPLNLMRRLPNGRKELATDHRVHKMLHYEPRLGVKALSFRQVRLIHQINRGNGYAEIIRDRYGLAQELKPIHPTRVTVDQSRDYSPYDYVYLVRDSYGTQQRAIIPDDMFHVRGRISDDDITGKGIVTQARESVGFGLATERHGAAFFGNGARPNVVVTHPGRLSDQARINFRKEWKQLHGGPDKAGELALLQEGAKVELMNVSNEDSQFLESRQFNTQEIARWYSIPPHMIGDLSRATFSNIESQGIDFVTYSLNPWLVEWESEIHCKLLSTAEKEEYYAKHNVNALLRGDSAARAAFYQAMWNIGVFSTDDILALEDMNPLKDGGDLHFVPLNMTTLERLAKGQEEESLEIEPASEPVDSGGDDEDEDSDEEQESTPEPMPMEDDEESSAAAELKRITPFVAMNFDDVSRLFIRKECETVMRLAGNPKSFLDKIEDFYADHVPRMVAALRIPLALKMSDITSEQMATTAAERLVVAHVAESKEQILRAAECKPAELQARIAALCAKWGSRKLSIARA